MLTYRDLQLLRSVGFRVANSGYSWWGKDRYGNEWQAVIDDEQSAFIQFIGPNRVTKKLNRETFDQLFS